MTNTLALGLGTLVVLLLIADQYWMGGANTLFVAREFAELIEWIAFWR